MLPAAPAAPPIWPIFQERCMRDAPIPDENAVGDADADQDGAENYGENIRVRVHGGYFHDRARWGVPPYNFRALPHASTAAVSAAA